MYVEILDFGALELFSSYGYIFDMQHLVQYFLRYCCVTLVGEDWDKDVVASQMDVVIGSPASNILQFGCLGDLLVPEEDAFEASVETTPNDVGISPDPTLSNGSKVQDIKCSKATPYDIFQN